jgi:hypothetical protein
LRTKPSDGRAPKTGLHNIDQRARPPPVVLGLSPWSAPKNSWAAPHCWRSRSTGARRRGRAMWFKSQTLWRPAMAEFSCPCLAPPSTGRDAATLCTVPALSHPWIEMGISRHRFHVRFLILDLVSSHSGTRGGNRNGSVGGVGRSPTPNRRPGRPAVSPEVRAQPHTAVESRCDSIGRAKRSCPGFLTKRCQTF